MKTYISSLKKFFKSIFTILNSKTKDLGIVTRKEYEDAVKLMETLSPIKNPQMPPPDKYDLPLTIAQEIGWNTKPLVSIMT